MTFSSAFTKIALILDPASAVDDVLHKKEADLEKETALKWANRAAVAYGMVKKNDPKWIQRAEDLEHEALEHASLVKDYGKTVGEIQKALDKYKPSMLKEAKDTFKMRATPAKHGGKDGRKTYTLTQDKKKWSCTCPDYIYRRAANGDECKHIKAKKSGKKAWEV